MATEQITINGGTITMGNVLELPMPYGDIRDGFEVIINHTDARAKYMMKMWFNENGGESIPYEVDFLIKKNMKKWGDGFERAYLNAWNAWATNSMDVVGMPRKWINKGLHVKKEWVREYDITHGECRRANGKWYNATPLTDAGEDVRGVYRWMWREDAMPDAAVVSMTPPSK